MGNFEIYSMGNPEFLIEVFKGLSRLWSTGDIYVLFSIALVLGILLSTFKWAIEQDKSPFPAKGFVISLILIIAFLGPNSITDVTVISKRDNTYQQVANVPLLPALSGWMITGTISVIADQFAQAFSIVGVENTYDAFSPIQHFVGLSTANFQPACVPIGGSESTYNVCKTLQQYLADCYTTSMLLEGSEVNPVQSILKSSPQNLLDQIKIKNKALQTTVYLSTGANTESGIPRTCIDAHADLTTAMNSTQFKNKLTSTSTSQGLDLSKVNVFLQQQSSQGTIPDAESSLVLAQSMFLNSTFADYFNNSPYGNQVAKGMFDTVNQRHLANAQKKEYWMENAEMMQSFFEAFAVFITPFIGLTLAVSAQALMAVAQYFMVWAFVNLWSVMLVLVNGFMAMAMTNRFTEGVAAGESHFSLTSIDSQFTTANSYISMGGMLYTFIPALTVFLLYRGVHAMQGLASKSMQDPNINAQRFAPDTGATANQGQVAFGNQNSTYQNETGTFDRGNSFVKSEAVGQMAVGSSAGTSMSAGAQKVATEQSTIADSAKSSYSSVFGSGQSGGTNYSAGESSSAGLVSAKETLNQTAQSLVDTFGVSKAEAQNFTLAGGVQVGAQGQLQIGTPGKGADGNSNSLVARMGFGASAEMSGSVDYKQARQTAATIQKQMNESDSTSEKLQQSFSQVKTAGEEQKYSDVGEIKKAFSDLQEFNNTASKLDSTSAQLAAMTTDSSQISGSKNIDTAQMASHLGREGYEGALKGLEGHQVNGQSAQDYLNNREAHHLTNSVSNSVDKTGDARALAVQDLIKENDSISMNADGTVNTEQEKKDSLANAQLFSNLAESGIGGAGAASELYENRAGGFETLGNTVDQIDKAGTTLDAAKGRFEEGHNNGVVSEVSDSVSSHKSDTAPATAQAAVKERDVENQGKVEASEVATSTITAEDRANLDAKEDKQESNLNATQSISETVTDAASNALKPGAVPAMANFIAEKAEKGQSIEGYEAGYGKAVEAITKDNSFTVSGVNDRLQPNNTAETRETNADVVSLLNNDAVLTEILGKNDDGSYGTGTSTKTPFDSHTLERLSDAANKMATYNDSPVQSQRLPTVNAERDSGGEPTSQLGTYLDSVTNQGTVQKIAEDGFGNDKQQAAEDLKGILNGDLQPSAMGYDSEFQAPTTTYSSLNGNTTHGDRGDTLVSARNDVIARVENIEEMASNAGHIMTQEERQTLNQFTSAVRQGVDEYDGLNASSPEPKDITRQTLEHDSSNRVQQPITPSNSGSVGGR